MHAYHGGELRISELNGRRTPEVPFCGAPRGLSARRRRRQTLTGLHRQIAHAGPSEVVQGPRQSTESHWVTASSGRTPAEPPARPAGGWWRAQPGADPGDLHAYSHGNQRPVVPMPQRSPPLALYGYDTQGLATARDEPG